jgi:Zn ribbon nucleic-acid-binding protein
MSDEPEVLIVCPSCHGSGKIVMREDDGVEEMDCPTCSGEEGK